VEADASSSDARLRLAARLRESAREAYHASRHAACAEAYAELERVARGLGNEAAVAEARFWQGTALHGAGRLTEALFAQLREARLENRRSRLLLSRARLALSRGRLCSALALGEESLSHWRRETHTFTGSSHYWVVVTACLWLGDLTRARRHLDDWAGLGEGSALQRALLACKKAELARREGELGRALAISRGAWFESAASEDHQQRIFAGHAYLRALLLAGRLEPAREVLAQLFGRLQRMEFAEHAFVLRALHADWHLARARLAAGLAMIDPECGLARRPRRPGPERAVAVPALARARRLYARALAHGSELDRLLGTRLRRWEIEARLALCDRTERELARR
jgi:tetratricopeptide (TPR) repeat protein